MSRRLADQDLALAIWRAPFAEGSPKVMTFTPGTRLSQMVIAMEELPPDFSDRGVVVLDGHVVYRAAWRSVKPKRGSRVTFHYPLAGGGRRRGGAGKAVLGIVIAVATLLTAGAAAGGAFQMAGGWFTAGSMSAKILAGSISLIGSLAQAAISKPPAEASEVAAEKQRGAAAASGNVLARGAAIPRVVGTRWIYPALGSQPFVYRDGPDEYVEAVFILAGPHLLEDIEANKTPIADAEDLEYDVREGWGDDPPISLVNRYAVTKADAAELSAHDVTGEEQDTLRDQGDPTKSLPKWLKVSTSREADEVRLDLSFPQGLRDAREEEANARLIVPFRLRARIDGGAWVNMPELLYASAAANELRPTIRLRRGAVPETIDSLPPSEGWVGAYKYVAAQSGFTGDWTADASFSAGSGNNALYRGNETTSNVRRVVAGEHECLIWLDPTVFTSGLMEIEIKRGFAVPNHNFNKSTHALSGNVVDMFWYRLDGAVAKVAFNRAGLSELAYLVRTSSVFERHPIKGGAYGPGLAVVAMRGKNRQLDNVRVRASGYVPDWDGTAWSDWTTTSNPVPHYRYIMTGDLTPEKLEGELIDDESLLDWRQACIDNDYRCDLICEGAAIGDVLDKLAGCGYARPRMSETWGVIRDYDRSGEDPVQVFTMRNSAGLSMAKAFPLLPDAFRATFKDASNEDADREVFVWRPGREGTAHPRMEQVTYHGFGRENDVINRAEFDLLQGELRSAFWSFRAPAEAIVCRRGDLIAVNHEVLDLSHDSARVTDVEIEGGDIVALSLDSPVRVYAEPAIEDIEEMSAVDDMSVIGLTSAIQIRAGDGAITPPVAIAGATGERDRIALAVPLPLELGDDDVPLIRNDSLAFIGRPGVVAMRLIVTAIGFDGDYTASITGVAEAPELFAA